MKNLTVAEFEAGLKDGSITIVQILAGATGVTFIGLQEGTDEILFRVTGL